MTVIQVYVKLAIIRFQIPERMICATEHTHASAMLCDDTSHQPQPTLNERTCLCRGVSRPIEVGG